MCENGRFAKVAQITKNTITFQRGRFRYRSKRRCKALSALQIIHTHYSNSMQRNTYISREYHHAGHPARHCAARHQTNLNYRPRNLETGQGHHYHGRPIPFAKSTRTTQKEERSDVKHTESSPEPLRSGKTVPGSQSYDTFSAEHVLGKE